MNTKQQTRKAESISLQINDNAVKIIRALDDLHVKIVESHKLESQLTESLKDVSSVPSAIHLPLLELDKMLQEVFNKAYYGISAELRSELMGQGIADHNWFEEFSGTKERA